MFQIIYASKSRGNFTTEALNGLLAQARINNASLGISGMLLYEAGAFLQVLEGPEENVRLMFESISRDQRHFDLRVLHCQAIAHCEFAEWSMGFLVESESFRWAPGKVDYRLALLTLGAEATPAKRYLSRFHLGRAAMPAGSGRTEWQAYLAALAVI